MSHGAAREAPARAEVRALYQQGVGFHLENALLDRHRRILNCWNQKTAARASQLYVVG